MASVIVIVCVYGANGGDGLLAAELLKVAGDSFDHAGRAGSGDTGSARTSGQLRQLNQGALDDPRVRVRVDDAFRFVQRQGERFDAIFVDFPYPTSFELLKLFSVEFYGFVRARLNPGGFAVMDAPIWKSLDEVDEEEGEGDGAFQPRSYEILLSTVRKAGFKTTFSFGPLDPLLFLKTEESAPQFDYGRLPEFVSNSGSVNMTDLRHIVEGARLKDEFYNFWSQATNTSANTNYLVSGDFWKIREVSLSYNIPAKWFGFTKNAIKGATFTLSGRNLFMFLPKTNEWTDPEFSNTTGPRV